MKYACIIPCFNEAERIKDIFNEIVEIDNNFFDWFILDNGSTDESYKLMQKNLELHDNNNIYLFRKDKNSGYGAGIKFMLAILFSNKIEFDKFHPNNKKKLFSPYKAIGWTHADGQTPLKDILVAQKILDFQRQNYFLIKGIRVQRKDSKISTLFTTFLSLIQILFFNRKIISHNSQPTFVSSKLLKKVFLDCQNTGLFDLSISILCLSHKCQITRFPVIFQNRETGEGANEKLMQKIIFSLENLKYILKMRSYSRFNIKKRIL